MPKEGSYPTASTELGQYDEGRKGPGTWKNVSDATHFYVNETPKSPERESRGMWMRNHHFIGS